MKKRINNVIRKNWQIYLMFLPAAVLLFIFCYVPMYGIVLAFKEYSPVLGIMGSEWVGLEHFKTLFSDSYFLKVLLNTVRIK